MQIVIDIDENVFTRLFDNGIEDYAIVNDDLFAIAKTIRKCTPLPKGHGRLIDADRLRSIYSINRANFNTVVGIQKWIDDAPTIIKKDKEQEE